MLKEILTKENSETTWLTAKDYTPVSMALSTRVNLKMIYKTAKVKKNGVMVLNLKVHIKTA